jgi:PAS domain S-box-containing protein
MSFNERQQATAFNRKAEQLTGLSASQVIGEGPDLLPPALQQIIKETFSTGNAIQDRRIILRDPRRGDLAIQVSATPTMTEPGGVSGVVVVLNDISVVKKWEANMRRLDRLHSIGTLSASMAHEVRNAFVPIRTFVDLLLEKNQEADLADIVRLEMTRIDSIIGQMLKFSGPPKPTFSTVHVHFVLDKSLLLIQRLLNDKRIKLTRSFGASSDVMEGDQDQLEQAFLNLFFNALDAMEPNGQLEVATELLPPDSVIDALATMKGRPILRVTVRDSGIGIPAENMDRLYEPFFTTKPDGTGLGLAITRRIIHEHQGIISVESEVNKGTTFSLLLPARNADA